MKTYCIFYLIFLTIIGCKRDGIPQPEEVPKLLFELLDQSVTNIDFINRVQENTAMNGFNYQYLYNGAGMSVADLNNDGLPDIYFAANLIDNQLYLNKGDFRFKNVTEIAGVKGKYGFPQGTTMVDINSDGLMDIYICKSGAFNDPDKRRNELYVNQGNNDSGVPFFKEDAKIYGLDLPHYATQASFFDYDLDGDLDMFLICHNPDPDFIQKNMEILRFKKFSLGSDRLFRNDKGFYIDVSEEAGIINDAIGFGLGLAIGDINNDGWPDVLVSQDYSAKDRMYLNQKNGIFKDVILDATGHISTFSMGNDIADYNNDGWLDFITVDMVSEDNYGVKASMSGMNPKQFNFLVDEGFHHQYMYNTLQLNNGTNSWGGIPFFSDVASIANISSTGWSWGPLFFDMDNDGDKDLFISNGIKRDFRNVDYTLYKKKRTEEFKKKLATAPEHFKEAYNRQFVEEMLRRMPERKQDNYFFENHGNHVFSKKNSVWANNKLTATNGAVYVDLDNDGDLDIVTNNMDDNAFIYRNKSMEFGLGNYLKVRLKGSKGNIDGIGSRISIKTALGNQIVEQYLSRGFQSSIDRVLHFGLGNTNIIDTLQVLWPDGKIQVLTNLDVNGTLELDQKDAKNLRLELKASKRYFKIKDMGTSVKHIEGTYDDFKYESLLPHKMSEEGPAFTVGDVNNDGLEDFYIGGAKGNLGALYIQDTLEKFNNTNQKVFRNTKPYEDVDAEFFDADMDGDLDLYVVSGSNEFKLESKQYKDRLYINEEGKFKEVTKNALADAPSVSGSVIKPHDYDGDGDLDLFVGGRQTPGKYPNSGTSFVLRNDSEDTHLKFTKIQATIFDELGMVTDAKWSDIDGDNVKELIVIGEWMPIKIFKNDKGVFTDITDFSGLADQIGWWFSLETADFDNDGDLDIVAGNLGLNSKYKASFEEPFQVFAKDFDSTGSLDIVLSYNQKGKQFPLRGRECSSNQMPFIKKKFPSYHEFALAELATVYGEDNLNTALSFSATNFATSYFQNNGKGVFTWKQLPREVQFTVVKKIITEDVNDDGFLDMLLFGNMSGFEVETPKQDAGYGIVLLGQGNGEFKINMPYQSGLFINGDIADGCVISSGGNKKAILIAKNNDFVQMVKIYSENMKEIKLKEKVIGN